MKNIIKLIKRFPNLYHRLLQIKRQIQSLIKYNFKYYINYHRLHTLPVEDITVFEYRKYSQNGEDGVIDIIFEKIGTTNKYFVEFGVQDASECNARFLRDIKGWTGLWMDAGDYQHPYIKKEFINAENINELFKKYLVPTEFDLLSIDIDFNDYYIWKAVIGYNPRVVIVEYNASAGPAEALSVKYDTQRFWDGTNYFGASLMAFVNLARKKGYTLIGCESTGVNAFFVRNDLIQQHFVIQDPSKLFKGPKYGKLINGQHTGHPASSEQMITVE